MKRQTVTRSNDRSGAVLVLFAILLFVLIPLASLILQSGWLTLTRRQMQTSVNAAAREALRRRDAPPSDPMIPADTQRRLDAASVAAALFDDDLNVTATDVMRFSAGPVINFAEETSPLNGPTINDGTFIAGRLIEESDQEADHQYDPRLRRNLGNNADGDIVAGTYGLVDHSAAPPTVDPDEEPTGHEETSDYERDDFLGGESDRAVLARMRRTDEFFNFDENDSTRSAGPPVPFLFGRGPFGGPGIANEEDGERDFMSYAEQGSNVRATSIADAVPAWTVGRHTPDRSSAAEFFLSESVWRTAVNPDPTTRPATTTFEVRVNAGQLLIDEPVTGGGVSMHVGSIFTYDDPSTNMVVEAPPDTVCIATGLFEDTTRTSFTDTGHDVYVPLTSVDPADANRYLVCGFVRMTVTQTQTMQPGIENRWQLSAASQSPPVAFENASAAWIPDDDVTMSGDALSRLRALAADGDVLNTLLHAPALRRTIH